MKIYVQSKFDERYDESCLETIKERLNSKDTLFVVADNDSKPEVQLDEVCGEVVGGSAEILDGQINYEVKLLNTPYGKALKPVIEKDHETISIGLACIGKVTEDNTIDSTDLSVAKGYLESSENPNILRIE